MHKIPTLAKKKRQRIIKQVTLSTSSQHPHLPGCTNRRTFRKWRRIPQRRRKRTDEPEKKTRRLEGSHSRRIPGEVGTKEDEEVKKDNLNKETKKDEKKNKSRTTRPRITTTNNNKKQTENTAPHNQKGKKRERGLNILHPPPTPSPPHPVLYPVVFSTDYEMCQSF